MQLGFVIDHTRCIGCHACTVACKAENDVPLGSFRTWVKYVEEGEFPTVRRHFAVLRCNQCSDAPCITICPVSALEKRSDGIVDVDPDLCIGCKACMHGCPYDALYLNEGTGTAEKCHFCAHRTERGLAPACAVVCPTEAIIPGDFHDPESRVSKLAAQHELTARKPEAGTGPNVLYREVDPAGIDPGDTNLAGDFIWSAPRTGAMVAAQEFEAMEKRARARTTYDVPRQPIWGWKITGYLWFKSLAAGIFPAGFLAHSGVGGAGQRLAGPTSIAALVFLAVTCGLLVADLKRPERFLKIVLRPNWSSWLARGTYLIGAYGALLAVWIVLGLTGDGPSRIHVRVLGVPTTFLGLFAAMYTGALFAQAKGRVLWMKRGYAVQLGFQALLAGSAWLLACGVLSGMDLEGDLALNLRMVLVVGLAGQVVFVLAEARLAPPGREREYRRAARLVSHGPFAALHWSLGIGVGVALPLGLLFFAPPTLMPAAGALALLGLWVEEDIFVRAGQALPIS